MNSPDSQHPRERRDPDRLLARGLLETTPAFEGRFDDLRRRLANEPPRRTVFSRALAALRGHPGRGVGVVAALAGLVFFAVETRTARDDKARPEEIGWHAELAALDNALSGALLLTDSEVLEILSSMPVDSSGGGS